MPEPPQLTKQALVGINRGKGRRFRRDWVLGVVDYLELGLYTIVKEARAINRFSQVRNRITFDAQIRGLF